MEPAEGLEPPALTLQMSCATIAPCRQIIFGVLGWSRTNSDGFADHFLAAKNLAHNGAVCGNRTRDPSLEGSYVTSTPIPHKKNAK